MTIATLTQTQVVFSPTDQKSKQSSLLICMAVNRVTKVLLCHIPVFQNLNKQHLFHFEEKRNLLFDLDVYGGAGPDSKFCLFLSVRKTKELL